MKLTDFVIDFFENKNIKQVFHISGGGCMHLTESLSNSKFDILCPHHEQTALMAAEGYTRMTNLPALTIVTTGPGGTNSLTGLLGLWLDSIPSIIISGQVPTNQLSKNTGCRQIGDQEFDIVQVVKPMTKYAKIILNKNDIKYELEKAFQISISGRPGPVWLDIPLDIQGSQIEVKNLREYKITKSKIEVKTYSESIKKMIDNSEKPLFIVGNGVRLSNSFELMNKLLELSKIPVVTGPHSGVDAVDNTYKYYSGRIGRLGQLSANKIVQDADLLICIGSRLPVKMTGYNLEEFSPKSKKIYIDIDENEINKHQFKIDLIAVCEIDKILKALTRLNYNLKINNWQTKILNLRLKQVYVYPKHINLLEYVSFYYFISRCPKHFNKTPIVTSNGTAHVITLQTYQINQNQRLFTNVGCASMGYGLPAAIGACKGNNNNPVICIEGDGSIMMNLQELETVKGNNLPIKIILINNQGYLSIKLTQNSFFKGNEFAAGPKSGVTFPSFKKISNAFNIKYISVSNNNEVDSKLKKMMELEGPCIMELFTHPLEKHEPKVTPKGIDKNGKIIPGSLTDMTITDTF